MNTGFRRQQYQQAQSTDTPGWVLLCVTLALCLIALPCTILGFLAERFLARWLPWRLSFLLWFALLFASALFLYSDYQHSLQHLINRELADYILAVRHYQTDLAHYPLRQLWAETWPVWLHTLSGIGIAVFGQNCTPTPALIRLGHFVRTIVIVSAAHNAHSDGPEGVPVGLHTSPMRLAA